LKISDRIDLIASGLLGFSLTHDNPLQRVAVDGAREFAPIDSACGIETDRLIDNLKRDAIRLDRVRLLPMAISIMLVALAYFETALVCRLRHLPQPPAPSGRR
jgi:hypothetical protein